MRAGDILAALGGRRDAPAQPAFGVVLMVVGCGLLTGNDAAMKALVAEMPVGQAVALRGLVGLLLLLTVTPLLGGWPALRPRNPRAVGLLTGLLLVSMFLFPAALVHVPLADAIMLAYLSPVVVAALSPWLLREQVGWRRWSAVAAGLLGAWLVIDPASGWHPAMVLPLIVAVLVGFRDILTRRHVVGESALALVAAANIGAFLVGLFTVPAGWVALTGDLVALIVLAALLVTAALVLMTEAFRHTEAPVLSCLKYVSILYAAALGWGIWGEAPGPLDLLGGAMIALSGVVITLRTRTGQKR